MWLLTAVVEGQCFLSHPVVTITSNKRRWGRKGELLQSSGQSEQGWLCSWRRPLAPSGSWLVRRSCVDVYSWNGNQLLKLFWLVHIPFQGCPCFHSWFATLPLVGFSITTLCALYSMTSVGSRLEEDVPALDLMHRCGVKLHGLTATKINYIQYLILAIIKCRVTSCCELYAMSILEIYFFYKLIQWLCIHHIG